MSQDTINSLVPDPINDFDDSVLPFALFSLTIVVGFATLIFHLYQILSLVILYFVVNRGKSYWSKLIKQYSMASNKLKIENKDNNPIKQNDYTDTTEAMMKSLFNKKPTKFEQEIVKFDYNFALLIWVEIAVDYVLDKLNLGRGADFRSSISFSKSLQAMVIRGGLQVNIEESNRKVVQYLTKIDEDKHECRLCSVEYSINKRAYVKSILCQVGRLLNHCLCIVAIIFNYNQPTFYLTGTTYLIASIPFILIEFINKLNSCRNLQTMDVCGYQKFYKLNETVLIFISIVNFVVFLTTYIFYCGRDDFIRTMVVDFMSNIY